MHQYQARWISKQQLDAIKGTGMRAHAMILDTYKGFIVVEPTDKQVGDGEVLSIDEADYELQDVWFLGPKSQLREARRRLGLEQKEMASA